MINIKYIYLIVVGLIFQSCASVLTIDEKTLKFTGDSGNRVACVAAPKVKLTSVTLGKNITDTDAHSPNDHQILLIKSEFNKIFNIDVNCSKKLAAEVEIVNMPVEERRGLLLLNMITIGIIPYWTQYENYLIVTVYKEDGNIIQRYRSSLNYERVQSLFLIPVMGFYLGGEIELNLKTIPLHFNNISEEIHKSAGLR